MKWNSVNGSLLSIKEGDDTYEYTYFSDGQRLSKKVGGQNTVYIYNAGMLLAEETDKDRLNFYYDADGFIIEIGYQEKNDGLNLNPNLISRKIGKSHSTVLNKTFGCFVK